MAWLTEAERNSASFQPSLGLGVGDGPGPSAVPAGQQEAIPAGLCYGAAEHSTCFRHVCECHFIGPAVSAVEEFVTNIRKTLPGSCAAVWGLQLERGTHGGPQAVPVSRGMEASSLWGYLWEQAVWGEQRGLQSPAEHNQIKCYQLIEADQKEMENCSQIIAYFLGGGIILETSVPDSGFALILVPHVISIPQE